MILSCKENGKKKFILLRYNSSILEEYKTHKQDKRHMVCRIEFMKSYNHHTQVFCGCLGVQTVLPTNKTLRKQLLESRSSNPKISIAYLWAYRHHKSAIRKQESCWRSLLSIHSNKTNIQIIPTYLLFIKSNAKNSLHLEGSLYLPPLYHFSLQWNFSKNYSNSLVLIPLIFSFLPPGKKICHLKIKSQPKDLIGSPSKLKAC